jgi:hemoglobin-like flavoprotein
MSNKQEIQAVQRTFEMIMPMADTFAFMFYGRFFQEDPSTRSLFKNDMSTQREKVMDMLAIAVRGLDDPESMLEELQGLGLRHVTYHVEPEHYTTMNEAIIWALAECLGENFTGDMRAAWYKALDILTGIMLESAAAGPSSSA